MTRVEKDDDMASVFHAGELAVQAESGVKERMHKLGNALIRDYIIDQHKEFFENLPYVFVALQDQDGRPWMSLMQGAPGFISTPDQRSLCIKGRIIGMDTLNLQTGKHQPIGLVGLDLGNRRRNRLNGRLKKSATEDMLSLAVGHSFGNCPKYIQLRHFDSGGLDEQSRFEEQSDIVETMFEFDESAIALINRSDTLFIASAEKRGGELDASHRGGRPGFVRVENASQLWFNDYPGNNLFQTFGNLQVYSNVGLMFLDFESGDLLLLSGIGNVETQIEKPESGSSKSSKFLPRRFHFTLEKGFRLKRAVYGRWTLEGMSPFLTGDLN